MASADEQRFWSRVDVRGPYECWPWTGGKGGWKRRYGYLTVHDGERWVSIGAHRFVMTLGGVALPPGCEVHHRCENHPCVNPAHLEVCLDAAEHKTRHRSGCATHGEAYMRDIYRRNGRKGRACAECTRIRDRARYALKVGQGYRPMLARRMVTRP